jgi:hypothetical protein
MCVFSLWISGEKGDMKSDKKIETALGAFLILATLIGVIAMLSAVQKADHGTSDMPANADSVKN